MPKYLLILFIKFQHNGFYTEKSKIIIDYGLNFNMNDINYTLIASVSIQGDVQNKSYQANIYHIDKFYELDDLTAKPILDQLVIQKEPYILLYKKS